MSVPWNHYFIKGCSQSGYRCRLTLICLTILTTHLLATSSSGIDSVTQQLKMDSNMLAPMGGDMQDHKMMVKERPIRGISPQQLAQLVANANTDDRLPQPPTHRVTNPQDKILVVYSGPTELVNRTEVFHPNSTATQRKKELYRVNFEYFLKYGVQCETQDTVLVVTEEVRQYYQARVDTMNRACQALDHSVVFVVRSPKCLDLETVRLVLKDDVVKNLDQYDYFIYVNSGVSGPSKNWATMPWTDAVLAPLDDRVKMTGLSLNCKGQPHIQSMMYAVDRLGLEAIQKSNAVFDCVKEPSPHAGMEEYMYIVNRYERGISNAVMDAGYGITSMMGPKVIVFKENRSLCVRRGDRWKAKFQKKDFGRLLDLSDTLFFKTSRFMSEATKREINFTLEANFPDG